LAWERVWRRWVVDLWVRPRQLAVKRVAEKWYTRYGLLVFLPALMVCQASQLLVTTCTQEIFC
jgi:hypothetical protein